MNLRERIDKTEPEKKLISMRVLERQHTAMQEIAEKNDCTASELYRLAVSDFINQNRGRVK